MSRSETMPSGARVESGTTRAPTRLFGEPSYDVSQRMVGLHLATSRPCSFRMRATVMETSPIAAPFRGAVKGEHAPGFRPDQAHFDIFVALPSDDLASRETRRTGGGAAHELHLNARSATTNGGQRMSGKTVLITGASRGIGRAAALLAAPARLVGRRQLRQRRGCGAARSSRTIAKAGGRAVALRGDVSREDDVLAMFEGAETRARTDHAPSSSTPASSRRPPSSPT